MNDQFLNSLRRDPAPAFARQLKARLHALDAPAVAEPRSPMWRWLATAASVAALAFAFTFPAVRTAAEAFLDYFRVVNFAGVAFDPQRILLRLTDSLQDEGVQRIRRHGDPCRSRRGMCFRQHGSDDGHDDAKQHDRADDVDDPAHYASFTLSAFTAASAAPARSPSPSIARVRSASDSRATSR